MKNLQFIVMTCLLMFAASSNAVEQITYYHSDAAGSPIAATDDAGNLLWNQAYDAWGSPIPSPSGDPRGFVGASRDSDTGLSDLQARWYSPELGRMLAMDPVSFHEGNIQSFNHYAYGNNNPYRYEDPNGHAPLEFFTEAVPAFGQSMVAWGLLIGGYASGDWAMYYAGADSLRELQATNIAAVAAVAGPPGTGRAISLAKKSDSLGSDGFVDGYRAVSRAEADDIARHGLRPDPAGKSMDDKWFSNSREGAEKFKQYYPDLSEIIKVKVPKDIYDRSYKHPNIDNTGPGFCVACNDLGRLKVEK